MRAELWSSLAAIGCFVSLVGCHAPSNELESGRYGGDERFMGSSDTYTVANINITYEDEHGEIYTETSEVSFIINYKLLPSLGVSRLNCVSDL